MNNTAKILDQGFSCLVDNMGVIDAEHFISLIKRDDFDYTIWQREYLWKEMKRFEKTHYQEVNFVQNVCIQSGNMKRNLKTCGNDWDLVWIGI